MLCAVVWHRCRQLMAIWPSLHFLKVFSQPWEGDVTMVLPSSYMQIKKSITNPTSDDLIEACQQVPPCLPALPSPYILHTLKGAKPLCQPQG